MPITFQCQCGRKFRTADENAGRSATCPDCRTKLVVPAAAVEAVPSAPPAVLPPPLPEEAPDAERIQSEEVVPVPRRPADAAPYGRPRRDEPYDRRDDYPRRRPDYRRDDIRDRIIRRPPPSSSSGMTGVGIFGGIAMMIGAVVWFVGGMALGIFFIYPPILFIIGLIAFIKGLSSRR
jgi:hypothetical protein